MRPTILFWLIISTLVLAATLTTFMYGLVNSTAWTGMNNSAWENGFMMVVPIFAIGGFALFIGMWLLKERGQGAKGGRQ